MKKILLLSFVLLGLQFLAKANPGDTTIVPIHVLDSLTYYGTYSRSAAMPSQNVSYRKVFLLYTIGRYQCPSGSQYCGQWDYSLDFIARPLNPVDTPNTYEIARAITPYAGTGSVFNTSWTHTYWFDVTDFAKILKDSIELQAKYSGYSGGFTLNTKLMFIEGTPAQEVVSIKQVQRGYFNYGDSAGIESKLIPVTTNFASPATHADMLIAITGHGSDNNGCSEFCERSYQLKLNGTQIGSNNFWKKCGFCDIQAQTGTWIYDRGGWCPGEKVLPTRHHLPSLTANTNFTVDMDLDPYTAPNGGAGYSISSYVIAYKDPSFALDAEVEDIISPSKKSDYKKFNPSSVSPTIVLKNSGSTPLTSATITYGVKGQLVNYYNWTGSLQFLESTVVNLPSIPWSLTFKDSTEFFAIVKNPNGGTDQYNMNDTFKSQYVSPPVLPSNFIFRLVTNNTVASFGAINETSWKLYDQNGVVVKERTNNANSTTYNDTLNLSAGAYQLIMTDEGNEDGLNWWVYPNYPTNPGAGSFTIRNTAGGTISNNTTKLTAKYLNGDFGSKFIYNFTVDYPLSTSKIEDDIVLNVFPQPADDYLNIDLKNVVSIDHISLLDINGRVLAQQIPSKGKTLIQIPTKNYPAGIYSIRMIQNGQVHIQKISIQH